MKVQARTMVRFCSIKFIRLASPNMWISLDDANTNKELLERRAYESSTKMEAQICRDFHAWWLVRISGVFARFLLRLRCRERRDVKKPLRLSFLYNFDTPFQSEVIGFSMGFFYGYVCRLCAWLMRNGKRNWSRFPEHVKRWQKRDKERFENRLPGSEMWGLAKKLLIWWSQVIQDDSSVVALMAMFMVMIVMSMIVWLLTKAKNSTNSIALISIT